MPLAVSSNDYTHRSPRQEALLLWAVVWHFTYMHTRTSCPTLILRVTMCMGEWDIPLNSPLTCKSHSGDYFPNGHSSCTLWKGLALQWSRGSVSPLAAKCSGFHARPPSLLVLTSIIPLTRIHETSADGIPRCPAHILQEDPAHHCQGGTARVHMFQGWEIGR